MFSRAFQRVCTDLVFSLTRRAYDEAKNAAVVRRAVYRRLQRSLAGRPVLHASAVGKRGRAGCVM